MSGHFSKKRQLAATALCQSIRSRYGGDGFSAHVRNLPSRTTLVRKIVSRLMLEYLQSILGSNPGSRCHVPRLAAWLVFYLGFLAYAFSAHGGFLFIDSANLVVHEGGHNLFGWFGPTLGLWGGTLLQWLVPFLLATYFFTQRQTAGFVFCLFFFFENWLYTATYMADARAQELAAGHHRRSGFCGARLLCKSFPASAC